MALMPQSWVEGKQDRHAACYIISVSAFFSLVLQARAASRERTGTGPAPRLKDTLTGQMVGDGHICCCRAQTCDLVATVEGGVGVSEVWLQKHRCESLSRRRCYTFVH